MKLIHYFRYAVTTGSACLLGFVIYNHLFAKVEVVPVIKNNSKINLDTGTVLKQKDINPDLIANWHLFGKEANDKQLNASSMTTNKQLLVENPKLLPKSKLKLGLSGLFTHKDKTRGHAIITNNNGEEQPYNVGDEITKNIKLYAVYKNYIVINNNEKLEILDLPEFGRQSKTNNAANKFPKLKKLASLKNNS